MRSKLDRTLVKVLSLLLLLTGSLIVVSTVVLVMRSFVVVPLHDEWDMMTNWVWWQHEVGSALSTFHHQHNEHRPTIPRLFFFTDLVLYKGRGALNQITVIGLFSIYTLVLWWLVVRAATLTGWSRLGVAGGLVVLMFSAIHLENLLWGFQIQFLAVFLFATLAFWCLSSSRTIRSKQDFNLSQRGLFGGILLCVASTFTMANGMLTWPIGLLIGLRVKWTWRQTFFYVGAASASIGLYFHDFFLNPGHADPLVSLQSPTLLLHYMALYLGHPLFLRENVLATVLGVLGLVLATVLLIVFLCDKSNKFNFSITSITLVTTSWFVLGSALLTAAGRLNFGIDHATSSRYAIPAVVFWICLATVLSTIRPRSSVIRSILRQLAIFVMAIALVSALYNQNDLINRNRHWKSTKLAAVSSLLSDVYDRSALEKVYPNPSIVPKMNEELASMDLSFHSMPWADLPGKRMDENLVSKTATNCRGHIDVVNEIESDTNGFRLHGWAVDTDTALPPEVVIFGKEDSEIVGIAFTGQPRPDVEKLYPGVKKSGWFGHARVSTGQRITAYAIVDEGRSACQLKGQFVRSQH